MRVVHPADGLAADWPNASMPKGPSTTLVPPTHRGTAHSRTVDTIDERGRLIIPAPIESEIGNAEKPH